jgi:hypothetical protein
MKMLTDGRVFRENEQGDKRSKRIIEPKLTGENIEKKSVKGAYRMSTKEADTNKNM